MVEQSADKINDLHLRLIVPQEGERRRSLKKMKPEKVDVHLSMSKNPNTGQNTITIGSMVNKKWTDMSLCRETEWWNRLHYVPERYRTRPEEAKISCRSFQDELINRSYLKNLAHRPPRQEKQADDRPTFHPEINRRSIRYSGESSWWERLSRPSWIQADLLRERFRDKCKSDGGSSLNLSSLLDSTLDHLSEDSIENSLDVEAAPEESELDLGYRAFAEGIQQRKQSTAREEKIAENDTEELLKSSISDEPDAVETDELENAILETSADDNVSGEKEKFAEDEDAETQKENDAGVPNDLEQSEQGLDDAENEAES
ncbi:uncharacterized protein LOC135938160 [Cloeon dipterum]|uniref:uncharacterized protein LOC135938160 n=1 Tax=Cloeon dipterum TaxID=197152 RepID=UPI0032205F1E